MQWSKTDAYYLAVVAAGTADLLKSGSEDQRVIAKASAEMVAVDLAKMAISDENVVQLAERLFNGQVPADSSFLVCRHLAERIISDGKIANVSAEELADAYHEIVASKKQDLEKLSTSAMLLSKVLVELGIKKKDTRLDLVMDFVKWVGA